MIKKSNDIIKLVPQNKILVESDGPFSKVKDKKYYPQMLQLVYDEIATEFKIDNFTNIVYKNFNKILRL